ncbi:asparaginase [Patescibacteria group bacterium]|nr:asparaginase [Patescibacteria group bacterium]
MKEKILILLTGGTMDGVINPGDGKKLTGESAAKQYLDSLDLHITYEFKQVCTKDSRELTDDDRKDFLEAISKDKTDKVLVTHGTYTMAETGQFLKKHINKIKNKTVILTGSMIPLQEGYPGDAPFNLGFAIATLFGEKPGVYLAMNGHVFDPDKVYKNIEKEIFELLN